MAISPEEVWTGIGAMAVGAGGTVAFLTKIWPRVTAGRGNGSCPDPGCKTDILNKLAEQNTHMTAIETKLDDQIKQTDTQWHKIDRMAAAVNRLAGAMSRNGVKIPDTEQ